MKKVGGFLLALLGTVLILGSLLQALNIVMMLVNNPDFSSYGIGALVGSIFGFIIFGWLGIKSIKKGKSLMSGEASVEQSAA